jgi:hypothetical protein
MSTYPKGIETWVNRIDDVNIVFAADPNSLAAEIIAIEQNVGTMPAVESKPPVGKPVSYTSMSARLTDTLLGNQKPFVDLAAGLGKVAYGSAGDGHGQFLSFSKNYDPFNYYNGSDITIQASGVYAIDHYMTWSYQTNGYVASYVYINNVNSKGDLWHWSDFAVDSPAQFNYAGRWGTTAVTFSNIALQKGTRLRVVAENGTATNPVQIENAFLRCQFLRAIPGGVGTEAGQ